jgi:outer membrane lipoprotein carrier protein
MRTRLSCLVVSCVFLFAFSAKGEVNEVELKQKLSMIDTLSAQFVQRVFDSEEEIYQANGRLYVAKPQKVRWETQFPEESLMVADGSAVWNVDTFVEQITIFDQESAITNNPLVLLTTLDNEVWSQFSISKISDKPEAYEIQALESAAQIQRLTIFFAETSITAITSVDAQGQESRLEFSDVQLNARLEDALFNVDIPENYTVDDQR